MDKIILLGKKTDETVQGAIATFIYNNWKRVVVKKGKEDDLKFSITLFDRVGDKQCFELNILADDYALKQNKYIKDNVAAAFAKRIVEDGLYFEIEGELYFDPLNKYK